VTTYISQLSSATVTASLCCLVTLVFGHELGMLTGELEIHCPHACMAVLISNIMNTCLFVFFDSCTFVKGGEAFCLHIITSGVLASSTSLRPILKSVIFSRANGVQSVFYKPVNVWHDFLSNVQMDSY
jgi:hypothetical protein